MHDARAMCPEHGQVMRDGCPWCEQSYYRFFCRHPRMLEPEVDTYTMCPDCGIWSMRIAVTSEED